MQPLGDPLKSIFCQIDAIGSLVTQPGQGYTLGELRMVAEALRLAERAIENEIAWRVLSDRGAA
jgi:hypothetical protein